MSPSLTTSGFRNSLHSTSKSFFLTVGGPPELPATRRDPGLPLLPQSGSITLWYSSSRARSSGSFHQVAGASADEVLRAIQSDLQTKPDRGAMVPGLGSVRKARIANPGRGKGKRGGYRYLYLYLERKQHSHLLILLDKNEQEDVSEEQRKQIREWVAQLKRHSGD